ncbi:MAG: hypothetical protein IJ438_10320 [Clostridia bacterium]|nr:hypothetical protein [Clostridia bacterium]
MLRTFLLGAVGYPALELLTRGRTHYSMAIAGGASTLLIRHLSRLPIGRGKRAILCGLGITGIEYACGRLWNRSYRVWDYRSMPLNWRGQICLPYTLLWCGLSAGLLTVIDFHRR